MQKRAFIILLFGIHFLLNGQTDAERNTANILPFENINLVTDRDLYLSGESIWFRADVSLNDNQKELSKILYIELFNADQKSIVRKKIRINDGIAQGVLDIPSEFLSATYFLRAYTHYDKNFPVDNYFLSALQIINPSIGLPAPLKNELLKPTVYQINKQKNSTSSKIVFSVPKNLLLENVKAYLCNEKNVLQEGVILKNGWGMIDFQLVDSLHYNVIFINSKNDTLKKDLNFTTSQDYALESTLSSNGQQIVSIYQPTEKKTSPNDLYTLELTNNSLQVLSSSEFLLTNNQTQIVLPNSEISNPGLYYFILKDAQKRIVKVKAFLSKGKSNSLNKISVSEQSFKKRQEVSLDLLDFEKIGLSNIGFKVVSKGTVLPVSEKLDLYLNDPRLILTFLKTQFRPEELSVVEQDIFLQIFNYKLSSEEFKNLFYAPKATDLIWLPEVRDIGLSGIVVDKLTQKPVENVPIYLSIFKEYPQIHIYESRADGSFFFSLNNFESDQDVFLCPLFENTDELELKVNTDFSPLFPILKAIPLTIDSSSTGLIERMMVASQTAKAYDLISKNKDYSVSHLPHSFENPQISIVLDDYIETATLETVFKELVPSVRVRKRKDNYSLSIFDSERELFYNDPLILVDEVPIFNVNELMKISPELIEKIEVHKSPFILGDHTINGIIMIRTLTDNFGGMIMPKSSTFFEYQTLSQSFKFKAKSYSTPEALNSRIGDFRTLLYWNSLANKRSESQIKFYTSDQIGDYEAFVFGTQKNGQLTSIKLFNLNVTN